MTSSTSIVFPYKIVGGHWCPMISAGIRLGENWRPVEFYVDSGAAHSIVRAPAAPDPDIDYTKGRKVLIQVGDGSFIPVFLHDLPIQIGSVQIIAPIGFSAKLGVPFNLLGRFGVFNHFRVCFHETRRLVSFQPA